MKHAVFLAATQCLWLLASGLGLGLCYDFFRCLRRRWHRLTGVMDCLFCLVLLPSLWLLGLYVGKGQFHLFFYPWLFLGGVAYFSALSPLILGLFSILMGWVTWPLEKTLKKTKKIAKKSFHFGKNRLQ